LPSRRAAFYDPVGVSWDQVERLLDEMVAQQDAKVLALAREIVPHVTPEDLRNPHDFAPLVESAEFNYEDGILAGLRAAAVAVRAARRAG
jgi:hypothetical protein